MSAVAEAYRQSGWSHVHTATPDARPTHPCGYCWGQRETQMLVSIPGVTRYYARVVCTTCQGSGRMLVERRAVLR